MTVSLEQETTVQEVTSELEISGLLCRILKHHTLVSVKLPDSDDEYCSALLDVLVADGYWLLDELPASAAHRKVKPDLVLSIRGRLNGVGFRFESPVEATGESEGIAFYKMQMPRLIRYRQRRSEYRAPVSAGQSIRVALQTADGEVLEGELRDISRDGFRVVLRVSGRTELTRGDLLPTCQIAISRNEEISCEAEVRYVRHQKSKRSCAVGARFLGLEPRQRRMIRQFVAQLERHSVKLKANT